MLYPSPMDEKLDASSNLYACFVSSAVFVVIHVAIYVNRGAYVVTLESKYS